MNGIYQCDCVIDGSLLKNSVSQVEDVAWSASGLIEYTLRALSNRGDVC